MRALVVFESMFGSTQRVAAAIAGGLAEGASVELVEVGAAPTVLPPGIDLLVVGGPTHAFGMSRPPTRDEAAQMDPGRPLVSQGVGVREWLELLDVGEASPVAFAFDTHVEHPKILRRLGSAAAGIAGRLERFGLDVVGAPEHFWVHGMQGPVSDEEVDRARKWGEQLAHAARRV